MNNFIASFVVMLGAYLMISLLFVFSIFYKDYDWWLTIGALVIWLLSLVPIIIILQKIFGGRDHG